MSASSPELVFWLDSDVVLTSLGSAEPSGHWEIARASRREPDPTVPRRMHWAPAECFARTCRSCCKCAQSPAARGTPGWQYQRPRWWRPRRSSSNSAECASDPGSSICESRPDALHRPTRCPTGRSRRARLRCRRSRARSARLQACLERRRTSSASREQGGCAMVVEASGLDTRPSDGDEDQEDGEERNESADGTEPESTGGRESLVGGGSPYAICRGRPGRSGPTPTGRREARCPEVSFMASANGDLSAPLSWRNLARTDAGTSRCSPGHRSMSASDSSVLKVWTLRGRWCAPRRPGRAPRLRSPGRCRSPHPGGGWHRTPARRPACPCNALFPYLLTYDTRSESASARSVR